MAIKTISFEKIGLQNIPSGMVSDKPKLGRGNGSSHFYCNHFKKNGYSGYAHMAHHLFRYIVDQANHRDITLAVNILYMRDSKANISESRNYYMFFKDSGTAFIVKSFISEAPSEIKTNYGRFIDKPFMDIW